MKRIAIVLQSKVCGGEANSLNQIYETECYCGFIAMKKVKENKPICFFGLDCEKIFVILHCGNAVFHKDHVSGILIGVLISAPMGPIGMLCIQRTLNKGRWPAFLPESELRFPTCFIACSPVSGLL